MKKRSFLLPLASSLAALIVGNANAMPATVAPTEPVMSTASLLPAAPVAPKPAPLVLQRAGDARMAQRGHASHASHSSHASHASHYSSR